MHKTFTFLFSFFLTLPLFASQPVPNSSLRFIQNKGQLPGVVLYSAEIPQGWLFAEKTSFTYNFLEPAYFRAEDLGPAARQARSYQGQAFKIHFVGANPQVRVTAREQLPGYYNYFIGNRRD